MNNHASELSDSTTKTGKKCWLILLVFAFLFVVTLATLAVRFAVDSPVDYPDIEEHFKYGSTGGEREAGFPPASQGAPENSRIAASAFDSRAAR